MRYYEHPLTDLGYHVAALAGPGEIWGLDNMVVDGDDQRFWHLGYSGYPAGAVCYIDTPDKYKALAVTPDGASLPESSTEIPAADVVDLLVAEYGWPEGTRLVDGMPTWPER